jgi:hypothetical protein
MWHWVGLHRGEEQEMVKSRVDLLAKAAVKILRRSNDGRSTLALTDAVHGGGADDGSGT